ncbi:hypothetical protein FQA39_LY00328 [Lamprigera yunnana]|nr:hypothetical protein FQA39_LY00328 [Lamprigera yunnana]
MEVSKLIEKNDFDDEPPTMTPLPSLVLPQVFDVEGQPDPEPQPGPSKRPRTELLLKYRNLKTLREYEEIQNRVNQAIKELKEKYCENFSSEMRHDLYKGQKYMENHSEQKKANKRRNISSQNQSRKMDSLFQGNCEITLVAAT